MINTILEALNKYLAEDYDPFSNILDDINRINFLLNPIIEKYQSELNFEDLKRNSPKILDDNASFIELFAQISKPLFEMIGNLQNSKEFNIEILEFYLQHIDIWIFTQFNGSLFLTNKIFPIIEKIYQTYRKKAKALVDEYFEIIKLKTGIDEKISSIIFFRDDAYNIGRLFEEVPLKYALPKDKKMFLDKINNVSEDKVRIYIDDLLKGMESLIEDYLKNIFLLLLNIRNVEETRLNSNVNIQSLGDILLNLGVNPLYLNIERIRIYRNGGAHSNFKIQNSNSWKNILIEIWDNFGTVSVNIEELLRDLFKIRQLISTMNIILIFHNFTAENNGKNPLELEIEELRKK